MLQGCCRRGWCRGLGGGGLTPLTSALTGYRPAAPPHFTFIFPLLWQFYQVHILLLSNIEILQNTVIVFIYSTIQYTKMVSGVKYVHIYTGILYTERVYNTWTSFKVKSCRHQVFLYFKSVMRTWTFLTCPTFKTFTSYFKDNCRFNLINNSISNFVHFFQS